MAHEITTLWDVEEIPDADYLFLRVHRNDLDGEGKPTPGAFRNHPKRTDGMSVDWAKYRTPTETRGHGPQPPEKYAVVKFTASRVRSIPSQVVTHEPLDSNRAHSEVFGKKDTEVRERFMGIYEVEIPLSTIPN